MATEGIKGLLVETRDYQATRTFWISMGFQNVFETDHGSGQFVHPGGGPYVFVNQVAEGTAPTLHPILGVADADAFGPDPAPEFKKPFAPEHWGTIHALVADPDGRNVALDAPQRQDGQG